MAGIVRFDCYEVDLGAGQISKRGRTLRLRDQPFRVLTALLEQPGQVVTREALRHRLWPGEVFVDFDNVLNTAVGKLREALGDSADHPRFIETLPKHGYRFIAPVTVRVRYAMGPLLTECRLEEAIAEMEAAIESDPLSVFMRLWLAVMCYLDRQYDRAIEQSWLMVDIEPANYVGYWVLGAYTREKGLFDESIAAHHRAVELSGGSMLMLGWLGLALGQAGRTAEARGVLEKLQAAADRQAYVQPTSFAWTYLGLGDIDNAFVWLDRAVDGCDRMMVPIRLYPFFDPLRGDPRYAALLRKMKLT